MCVMRHVGRVGVVFRVREAERLPEHQLLIVVDCDQLVVNDTSAFVRQLDLPEDEVRHNCRSVIAHLLRAVRIKGQAVCEKRVLRYFESVRMSDDQRAASRALFGGRVHELQLVCVGSGRVQQRLRLSATRGTRQRRAGQQEIAIFTELCEHKRISVSCVICLSLRSNNQTSYAITYRVKDVL